MDHTTICRGKRLFVLTNPAVPLSSMQRWSFWPIFCVSQPTTSFTHLFKQTCFRLCSVEKGDKFTVCNLPSSSQSWQAGEHNGALNCHVKSHIFTSGLGGDQNKAKSRGNVGLKFNRWLKTELQMDSNVAP